MLLMCIPIPVCSGIMISDESYANSQVCTGVMYHRPLGCSESNYATCLQLIRLTLLCFLSSMLKIDFIVLVREEEINCIDSVVIKVAPLSSDNEDVFGQPRHSVEAVRVAATLREVDPCHEEKKVGPCRGRMPR